MKVLGVSGIEQTMPFKRKHWPGLDDREYRISQGHDSAAALVIDGEIVACVAEERLNRRKHTGEFPARSIHYCLQERNLALEDVDQLAHGFDYAPYKLLYAMDPVSSERSQERRVGKEGRSRWSPYHYK